MKKPPKPVIKMCSLFRSCIMAAVVFLAPIGNVFANDPSAYRLFNNEGNYVNFQEMIDSLAKRNVVFIGELHNCPIAHWMEYEITKALYQRHGDRLTIGEEMLEADNQLILNEYMAGIVSSDRFESEAKLWDNYSTDYYPVVAFAKENDIPFVATNIPRRYASIVKSRGLNALDSLTYEAKEYIAPLPIPFHYNHEESEATFGMMMLLGHGKSEEDLRRLAEAQAIKDATMAWMISQNLKDKFIHINGTMHSDFNSGILHFLKEYSPETTTATVTCVRQEETDSLDEDNIGRADFYICIPESMTLTY